jgi:hypothetical protein
MNAATKPNPAAKGKGEGSPARKAAGFKVEKERLGFNALILGNPNYFGNLKDSVYPVKKLMLSNTNFEQLMCVGFNPKTEYLEAVVHIKQEAGYGGDVCSPGTHEYIRFFLSFDGGVTWQDQGLTSFTAYDVPGRKPLEYSLRLAINPKNIYCRFEVLPKVRAILSWSQIPTAGNPNYIPVYGNVLDAHIQIGALKYLVLRELFEIAKAKVTPDITDLVDMEQVLMTKPVPGPGPVELAAMYKKNKIQPHRFLFKELHAALAQPAAAELLYAPEIQPILKEFKIDIAELVKAFLDTDGDTGYEELNCVGMCQAKIEWLTATFKVKRTYGYMGGLCTHGSMEYVAFWVDWGDGAGWTYAGTGAVNVHDLARLPAGGVEYSVSVPVNSLAHRQPCSAGPKTARVRAILSWQVSPPAGNPNYVPRWGNREETLVLLPPGPKVIPEDRKMYVDSVGNMAVCDIDQLSGLATGPGQIAAFNAVQSPFGGTIRITGFIINPPNAMADPSQTLKYRVSVRRLNDLGVPITGWQPLANDFDIVITEQNGIGLPVQYHHNQQIDGSGFYTYWEQVYTNQWRQVTMDKIASWETRGLAPGLWEILVEVKLPDGTILPPGTILCDDGTTRSTVKIRLDEGAPSANVSITGFIHKGTKVPATSCGTFLVGDTIMGVYSTFDPESHWGARSMWVAPAGPAHGAAVVVTPLVSSSAGQSGEWSLDTGPMDPCGYVVYLWTEDMTIVDSGYIGWENSNSTGFCLRLE